MHDEYFYHAVPSSLDGLDIPLGMGKAFTNDISELLRFSALTRSEQRRVLNSFNTEQSENSLKMHEKTNGNSM